MKYTQIEICINQWYYLNLSDIHWIINTLNFLIKTLELYTPFSL